MSSSLIEEYLKRTGQTEQDLFAGLHQYGPEYINNLVAQAMEENKKITFISELIGGEDLGQGNYILEEITAPEE